MGRDQHPRARQREQLQRKQNQRAGYDRILIVSEGSKTEPQYFREIRAAYRLHTANVAILPSQWGTEPLQVVKYARKLFVSGDRHNGVRERAFEQVYAVFDRDDHRRYFEALQLAQSLDGKLRNDNRQPVTFRAIVSIPSFELWLLLHYEDIRHPLHRDEVLRRLKQYLPDYEKGGIGTFAKTRDNMETAHQRARQLAERSHPYNDSEPYSDIADLVDVLQQLRR